jgi:hypothetical protein
MNRPEQNLHRAVAQFLDVALPADCWWTTIGHGWGKMNKATAGIAKTCGVKAGVPDILIVYRGRAYFIELKAAKGTESAAQKATAALLSDAGARRAVARSIENVAWALEVWGIPLRAKIGALVKGAAA